MKFESLGLSPPTLNAIRDRGYKSATDIQSQSIPPVLGGRDVLAVAQTGTGKTAAFTLPMIDRLTDGFPAGHNQARALILTPTRELALQIKENISNYAVHSRVKSAVVYGGAKINPQMMSLRGGVDILVATPGRLLDLHRQNAVKFGRVEMLVLDEADRMLDMGFSDEINEVLSLLPKKRQNLMFSATFSAQIRTLAKKITRDAVEITISPKSVAAVSVNQWLHPVDQLQKPSLLKKLLSEHEWGQVLVFTKTKNGADKLTRTLVRGKIKAAAIHGNRPQAQRIKNLARFKAGTIQVLVATDIASRGIDIEDLPHVVNFDLPNLAEDYVHRIGRTGRAGLSGEAISLVSFEEARQLAAIERLTGKAIRREVIAGFKPEKPLPATKLGAVKKIKKPKKPKLGADASLRSKSKKLQQERPFKSKRVRSSRKRIK
ncbi:DEAD/DEAH box helicase [Oligoflexaceae bacterium]|nr:DEAD/DEAH box helicase [Oligoflexaceae bacterium]